jgi:hypothetical protein
MKNKTVRQPELFVDSHHGIYSWQIAVKSLLPKYQKQIEKQVGKWAIDTVKEGPDNEEYWDAVNEIDSNVCFTNETGQKLYLMTREDIWLIPACYMRTRAYNEFMDAY